MLHESKGSSWAKSHKQNKSVAKRMQWMKDGITRLPLLERQETKGLETKPLQTQKKDNLPARKRVINEHNVGGRRTLKAVPAKDDNTFDALLAQFQMPDFPGSGRDHYNSDLAKDKGSFTHIPYGRTEESQPPLQKEGSQSLTSYVTSAERENLVRLSQWLDSSIKGAHGKRDEMNSILNHMGLAFFEIASQVYSNCQERGMLLVKIWRELTRLFQILVDSTTQGVTDIKAEKEVEKCKNRKLEDQVKMLSSLVSLWKVSDLK